MKITFQMNLSQKIYFQNIENNKCKDEKSESSEENNIENQNISPKNQFSIIQNAMSHINSLIFLLPDINSFGIALQEITYLYRMRERFKICSNSLQLNQKDNRGVF